MTDSVQSVIEEINWLQTAKKITWDNIRTGYDSKVTDANGVLRYDFSPAFPRELSSFTSVVDYSSGNARLCEFGYTNVSRTGFNLTAWWGEFATPLNGATIGFYFLAFGR